MMCGLTVAHQFSESFYMKTKGWNLKQAKSIEKEDHLEKFSFGFHIIFWGV